MTEEISLTPHERQGFIAFLEDIKKESDRGAVIIGAAKIDLLLQQILLNFFLANPAGEDQLFDGEAPLSTFNSRIHVAYRTGLIAADFTQALHQIRKIRNDCAHELANIDLNEGVLRDRVRTLIAPFTKFSSYKKFIEMSGGEETPAIQFRAFLAFINARLTGVFKKCERISGGRAFTLIPPKSTSDA